MILEISACQRMQFQEQLGHDQQLRQQSSSEIHKLQSNYTNAGGEAHLWEQQLQFKLRGIVKK